MARLTIITIPKWMGSTPRLVTMGRKMGARIMMDGAVSIKQPTNKRTILSSSSIISLLSVSRVMAPAICWGIWPMVRILVKAAAHPSTTSTVPVVSPALRMTPKMSRSRSSL